MRAGGPGNEQADEPAFGAGMSRSPMREDGTAVGSTVSVWAVGVAGVSALGVV